MLLQAQCNHATYVHYSCFSVCVMLPCVNAGEQCPQKTVHRGLHLYVNIYLYLYADWKETVFMIEVIARKMEEENDFGRQYV